MERQLANQLDKFLIDPFFKSIKCCIEPYIVAAIVYQTDKPIDKGSMEQYVATFKRIQEILEK